MSNGRTTWCWTMESKRLDIPVPRLPGRQVHAAGYAEEGELCPSSARMLTEPKSTSAPGPFWYPPSASATKRLAEQFNGMPLNPSWEDGTYDEIYARYFDVE